MPTLNVYIDPKIFARLQEHARLTGRPEVELATAAVEEAVIVADRALAITPAKAD